MLNQSNTRILLGERSLSRLLCGRFCVDEDECEKERKVQKQSVLKRRREESQSEKSDEDNQDTNVRQENENLRNLFERIEHAIETRGKDWEHIFIGAITNCTLELQMHERFRSVNTFLDRWFNNNRRFYVYGIFYANGKCAYVGKSCVAYQLFIKTKSLGRLFHRLSDLQPDSKRHWQEPDATVQRALKAAFNSHGIKAAVLVAGLTEEESLEIEAIAIRVFHPELNLQHAKTEPSQEDKRRVYELISDEKIEGLIVANSSNNLLWAIINRENGKIDEDEFVSCCSICSRTHSKKYHLCELCRSLQTEMVNLKAMRANRKINALEALILEEKKKSPWYCCHKERSTSNDALSTSNVETSRAALMANTNREDSSIIVDVLEGHPIELDSLLTPPSAKKSKPNVVDEASINSLVGIDESVNENTGLISQYFADEVENEKEKSSIDNRMLLKLNCAMDKVLEAFEFVEYAAFVSMEEVKTGRSTKGVPIIENETVSVLITSFRNGIVKNKEIVLNGETMNKCRMLNRDTIVCYSKVRFFAAYSFENGFLALLFDITHEEFLPRLADRALNTLIDKMKTPN
ncbi:hypothetical protein M3Y98_01107800 [Aphelenchoides besseyi]|nr:hypothetical protein M3Y98_01107800 [Aphelenchoides besseyi]